MYFNCPNIAKYWTIENSLFREFNSLFPGFAKLIVKFCGIL